MRVEDKQRMERTVRMMVTHMCGVTLKDKKSMEDLRGRLGIESVRCYKKRQTKMVWSYGEEGGQ
jgi:hypothetical protein